MMPRVRHALIGALAAVWLLGASCTKTISPETPPAPPATYSGPDLLRGTIGSMVTLNDYEPIFVSGYGLVARLNGTGSPDCPPALRQWLLNEMSKRGFGRSESGYRELTPERVLASDTTAVVMVEAMIPPGATKNTRFDVLVSALPQTQTTSLHDGVLYLTELRVGGADLRRPSGDVLAEARGPIFLNPFAEAQADEGPATAQLRGRILAGGRALHASDMQLITNYPSYRLTRQIADRINGRFPPDPDDKQPIAVPKSDSVVAINVIERYRNNPQHMLDLLSHLYLNPTPQFAQRKAEALAEVLTNPAEQHYADDVAYVWQGFGRNILPILRPYYDHAERPLRMAALQAGARLGDLRTAEPLGAIAAAGLGGVSEQATVLLGELLGEYPTHVRLQQTLRRQLDSDDALVRVAAFNALAAVEDPTIRRFAFDNKMELAQVRCDKPMIHVTRNGRPRVIIFNDRLGFSRPLMFSMWDNRLMLRAADDDEQIEVFYQKPGQSRPIHGTIPDNVGYYTGVMAFNASDESDSIGFNLSYSGVVSVLYQLTQRKLVDAPLVLEQSTLAERIARRRIVAGREQRQETDTPQAPSTPPLAPRPDSGDNSSK